MAATVMAQALGGLVSEVDQAALSGELRMLRRYRVQYVAGPDNERLPDALT